MPIKSWKNLNFLLSSKSPISYLHNSTAENLPEYFASCLEICPDISFLKKLHACVITHGLERNIFLGSKLFNLLAKFNLLAESKWVFNTIINSNLSLWNSIVVGYFRADHYTEVLGVYLKLRRKGIGIHSSAITFALKSCGELGASTFGRNLHAEAVRIGFSSDRFVGSSLIEFYTKCDRIGEAAKVFDEIADRDVVAYTSLITAYCKAGDHRAKEAFRVAAEMQMNGFEPNRVTLVSLLRCASQLRALDDGRSIHGYALRRGVGLGCADEVFETSLIDTYVKCGDPNAGAIVFDKMSRKTTGSRNALMAGYLKLGEPLEAFAIFVEMAGESELDLIAFANGLLSSADLGYLLIGKAIHCHIIREGVVLDVVGETALIDMYSKCKNLSAAVNVFSRSEAKDAAMLNVMISGYLHNGCVYRAIEMFRGITGIPDTPVARVETPVPTRGGGGSRGSGGGRGRGGSRGTGNVGGHSGSSSGIASSEGSGPGGSGDQPEGSSRGKPYSKDESIAVAKA
ncbi:pentatricopeptide repeat-containing protein At3g12770-like [Salvia splendens]|uniref:pentatricopeptide repeat-containing protein At3g12770-like n=1 Tax=Salvia splendens TaxID=180675 RepID=UPI001C25549B|nr:pentatricopeptide repeat-containing protein At3g12770-like [Salvia splendens]